MKQKNQHIESADLANQINNEIGHIEDIDEGLSDELKEQLSKFKRIQEFLLNGNIYGLLGIGLDHLKDRPFRLDDSKGREVSKEKLDRIKMQWVVAKNSVLQSPDGPIRKYSSPKAFEARKDELEKDLKREFDSMSLADLKNNFIELIIEYEKANQIIEAFQNEIDFLGNTLTRKYIESREQAVENQSKGKEVRFKENNDALDAVFKKFQKKLEDPHNPVTLPCSL